MKRSGKHIVKSTKSDMAKLVNALIEKNALAEHLGRHYNNFSNISQHPLNYNNLSGLCKWIDGHKN